MEASDRKRWLRAVILLGAAYFVFGIAFAAFAGSAGSNSMRETWNRLGFVASAIAFAIHIGYEHFRLRIALIAWPALTAVPAFVVALVAAAGLNLMRRST